MLEVSNLRVRYGAVEALRGISLEVREGEMVALIGSNGSGKSTCLRALAGLVRPVEGSIRFRGAELAAEPAHRIVARGISLVPEGRRLFGDQSVMDNLLLGAYRRRRRDSESALRAQAEEHLRRFPILQERRDLPAGGLSGGQQQMLAISRGLMAMPHVLLLDEPSLGLAPRLVREIFGIVTALRREGRTILLVEQMAHMALRVADRAYILEHGRIVLEGPARDLLGHPSIARAYLGGRATGT